MLYKCFVLAGKSLITKLGKVDEKIVHSISLAKDIILVLLL